MSRQEELQHISFSAWFHQWQTSDIARLLSYLSSIRYHSITFFIEADDIIYKWCPSSEWDAVDEILLHASFGDLIRVSIVPLHRGDRLPAETGCINNLLRLLLPRVAKARSHSSVLNQCWYGECDLHE